MLTRRLVFFLALHFLPGIASAEEACRVPEELFSIKLGGIYDMGGTTDNDFGNLPVKKCTAVQKFLGNGIHCYFQPTKEYEEFEYVERPEKAEDQYFETSFRLYLLPVIPSTITTFEQLQKIKPVWEVTLIEWSADAKKWNSDQNVKEEAYFWAIDLCKTFESDLSIKPDIYDNPSVA